VVERKKGMSKKEGARMRKARMKRGISISALSRETGIPFSTIQALETGRRNSNLLIKSKISNFLEIPFDKLWTDTPADVEDWTTEIQNIRMDLDTAERLFKDAVTKMKGEPST
jgi:transcriptional regulator with XRE-family HTH domain